MINCGKCKWWKPPYELVGWSSPVENSYSEDSPGFAANQTYGHCELIQMGPVSHSEPLPKAVVLDGSQYQADLYTQAEFGCVLGQKL